MESHNIPIAGFQNQRTEFIFYPERLQKANIQHRMLRQFVERLNYSRVALTENPLVTYLLLAFLYRKPQHPFLSAREGPCQCFRLAEIFFRVQEQLSE